MALKFGSKAWRAKYLKNAGKKRKTKRKTAAKRNSPKRKPAKRKTAKRTTKRKSPVRSNPPRNWTKVKAVRVIRKGGRDVLEIKK